jgi:hypothetical protein
MRFGVAVPGSGSWRKRSIQFMTDRQWALLYVGDGFNERQLELAAMRWLFESQSQPWNYCSDVPER